MLISWNRLYNFILLQLQLDLLWEEYKVWHDLHTLNFPVFVVEVDLSIEEAKKRVIERKKSGGHGPTESVFDQRVSEYTSFEDEFDVIHIDGFLGVEDNANIVVNKVLLS